MSKMPVSHEQYDPAQEAMLHPQNDNTLAIIDSYYAGEISEADMLQQIETLEESYMYDMLMGEF